MSTVGIFRILIKVIKVVIIPPYFFLSKVNYVSFGNGGLVLCSDFVIYCGV